MELSKGFHREVIEARESIDGVDFSEASLKSNVNISPLNSGGANFKTHVLVEKSSSKLAYRPSFGGALFPFIFLALGFGFIVYNLIIFLGLATTPKLINFFMLAFGSVFAGVGCYMCYRYYMPRIFDKQLGLYYKTYKVDLHNTRNDSENQTSLKSIIAIQIIGEHISDSDGSYSSFELNLVLDDGTRRNVVDHGNLKSIIDDAHILSNFLDVPIWHAKSKDED